MWDGTIAVLADPHLHDTAAGRSFGLDQTDCFRGLADTIHSTRVFNESEPAFRGMLDAVAAQGIGIVVIAGDLTDDGQWPNWARARALLQEYEERVAMRFFLTPGNHDQWIEPGLAQTKSIITTDRTERELSSTTNSPAMRRISQEETIGFASGFGYCRHPKDLHWETPFGGSGNLSDRMGPVLGADGSVHLLPDLSYLAEPIEGLWILSLDASVYLPEGDGWRDCSSEGWLAVLRHKGWLLDWMQDVAMRARVLGKRLVTFSHYPVVDVLNGISTAPDTPAPLQGAERRLMPDAACSERIAETGIELHFSGHWHMNRTGIHRGTHAVMTNVSVPSPVGYPAAWKRVRFAGTRAEIHTQRMVTCTGFDLAFGIYRSEGDTHLTSATDHDAFLQAHLRELVEHRYLPRDWPAGFADRLRIASLADLAACVGMRMPPTIAIRGMTAMHDLYALERGGQLSDVPRDRLELYRALALVSAPHVDNPHDHAAWRLLDGLGRHARGEDDDRFEISFWQHMPRVSAGAD